MLQNYITHNTKENNNKSRNEPTYGTKEKLDRINHKHLCVSSDNIKKFETDLEQIGAPYLKGIGYAELDKIKWGDAPSVLRAVQESYHFGFLSSPSNNLHYENKDKVRCIIHCSDAHQFPNNTKQTTSGELGHCFTWIKGEPSFQGLQYALEDIESRIKVQENSPFLEKTPPYIDNIIFPEKLELTSQTGGGCHTVTMNDILYFNRYMNSIIGGRGSGKTTLLEAIQHLSQNNPDCIVMKEGDNPSQRKSIKYIRKKNLDEQNILETYLRKNKEEFPDNLEVVPDVLRFVYENKLEEYREDIKNHEGNIKTYSSEKTQSQVEALSNLQQDIKNNTTLCDDLNQLKNELAKIEAINQQIDSINNNKLLPSRISKINIPQLNEIQTNTDKLTENLESLETQLLQVQKTLKDSFPDKHIESITAAIQDENNSIEHLKEEVNKIEQAQEKYSELTNRIPKIIENYKNFLEKKIDNIRQQWNAKIGLHPHHELDVFKKLALKIFVKIDLDNWSDTILEKLDGRIANYDTLRSQILNEKICGNNKSWNIMDDLSSAPIQDFFKVAGDTEKILKFLQNCTTKGGDSFNIKSEILKYIYSFEYISIETGLCYDNKSFSVLSAGEKGIISLLLSIDSGEGDIPLLIDQPEDNLDNSFIHRELIPILKEIKKKRQLIMVSHNANLVVNGDSELVFVAKNIDDSTGEFGYISGCLESVQPVKDVIFSEDYSMKVRICNIMEGGEDAFNTRSKKYGLTK